MQAGRYENLVGLAGLDEVDASRQGGLRALQRLVDVHVSCCDDGRGAGSASLFGRALRKLLSAWGVKTNDGTGLWGSPLADDSP